MMPVYIAAHTLQFAVFRSHNQLYELPISKNLMEKIGRFLIAMQNEIVYFDSNN